MVAKTNKPLKIPRPPKTPKVRRTDVEPTRKIDDPGGEVVTVDVYINGILEYHRDAVLYESKGGKARFDMKTDDGGIIKVKRSDDARVIASKLLKNKGSR